MRLPQSIFSGVVIAIVALTGLPLLAEAKPLRADIDGDGLSTWTETRRVGTNPHRADTDRDRLWDGTEVKRTKTSPLRADTDRDGLSDWTELRRTTTNPRKADSDGDGVDDGEEVLTGSDPRDPASVAGFPLSAPPDPVPTPGPSPPTTEEPEEPPPPPPPPDTTPPDTTLALKPSALTKSATAKFEFSGSDVGGSGVASFECRHDGGAWSACLSPKAYTGLGDGVHSFEVKAVDNAGNPDPSPASFSWTVDTTAPEPAIDSLSRSLLKAGEASDITWHVNENGAFELRVGGADCTTGTIVDSGPYAGQPATDVSSVAAAQLAEGPNTLRLCVTDAAGNRGQVTTTVSRDASAPETTITLKPTSLTNSATAKFEFSGSDGTGSGIASFECRRDGGAWAVCASPTEYTGLVEGAHSFEAKAVDQAGNVDSSPASFSWQVDTTPPVVQITSGPSGLTNDSTPTYGFSAEAGVSFECSIDEGAPAFGPCSGPTSHTPSTPLSEGPHTFRVLAGDAAGNQATATRSFNVDTTAPSAPELTATFPPSPANSNSPQVLGTAPAGTTVKLYTGAECTGSPIATASASQLAAGIAASVADNSATTFRATATTTVGNTSGCSEPLAYVEDSGPPGTTIETKPLALTNSATASFSFTGNDGAGSGIASFECRRDGGAWSACPSPMEYTGLGDGAHSFEVKAVDRASNVDSTPATFNWTVDTATPNTQIDAKPSALTNGTTADFAFTGSDPGGSGVASFECRRDGGAWAACPSPKEYTSLSEGAHGFEVKAIDSAGNVDPSPATFNWTIDTTAPETTITLKPASLTNSASAKFEFSGNDGAGSGVASFECRRDGGAWAACPSPKEYTGLADSSHSFEVKAIDQAGNVDSTPATFGWTVDTAAPDTQINTKPAGLTNGTTASFAFSGNDGTGSGVASFECRRDGGAWAACPSPKEYMSLTEGAHSFELKAIDNAGNTDATPAVFNWTIDSKAPETQITTKPNALANSTTASFTFSGNDGAGSGIASFECRRDGGAWAVCASPTGYTGLAEGAHSFEVKAIDQAGNVDNTPAIFSWTVDTATPDTQINTKPSTLTNSTAASFSFSGSDLGGSGIASFECRRDGGIWAACPSPKEYTGLADGAHSFEVKAVDQAGNVDSSPASFNWTVDTTPPAVQINSGPSGLTNDSTPTFGFSSEPGVSFECSIDTGAPAFGPCSGAGSHTPASPLADGPHTFRVRATDGATNQAAVTRSFNVDTAAPPAPELTATVPPSPANDNTPQVLGTAPAATTVKLYGNAECTGTPLGTVSA
ncbi:MAG: Ig-like domain-containing protein, partial [Solirubrobacterales bacterium]